MQATDTRTSACWSCGAEGPALTCLRCGAVQPVEAGTDLFAILGLPRRLATDSADLERRYHAASRAVHPDRYQTAPPHERELSLGGVEIVDFDESPAERDTGRQVTRMNREARPAGVDRFLVGARAAALFGELGKRNRRRILLDPAPQVVNA